MCERWHEATNGKHLLCWQGPGERRTCLKDADGCLRPFPPLLRPSLPHQVNGQPLPWDGSAFLLTAESDLLVLGKTIEAASAGKGDFTLQTRVLIRPESNFELSGFYKSGSAYCSQCEAEGFRRITYYLDRPDVMARFKVRIEAEKSKLPLLLSNGNKMATGELDGGRHFAEWEDPFPKPSYLFAVVAGDLGSIVDSYKTMSGRDVRLEIFSEHENVDKLEHAMTSLKKSMRWDEEVYGLEYDLDVYNIVAVNDFNMGAMENKGLNVFNTAFVLAKPETATDTDYERIEGVIAHEYFHNWSGNRVTCQDWFQLTLKEGLTVFRDQQFSADMGSAAVKRIEDVRVLRARQFAEDSGPRAHAIRPESYMKMDNFYTSTVYEKGAEVIRMYHTLLGAAGFRKGMDLYFARHDGSAVTCDDFRAAMADANGKDFSQFERWYLQAGTPVVTAKGAYDAAQKHYSLTLSQHTAGTVGQPSKLPFHIPVRVGLLGKDGRELVPSTVLELKEASQTFEFENVEGGTPVASLLRGFSAPVRLKVEQSDEDLAFLMAHDTDSFNRWEASQKLASQAILAATEALAGGGTPAPLAPTTVDAFRAVLKAGLDDTGVDRSLLAYALSLPDELTLLGEMDVMRPVALHEGREHVKKSLAAALKPEFMDVYQALDKDVPYLVTPQEIGRRRMKNVCLSYLCTEKDAGAVALAASAFQRATCMTDSIAALACLSSLPGPEKDEALEIFYTNAKGDPLVLNKWFSIQALADLPDTIDRVHALTRHPDFSMKNPNRFRALIGAFANSNLARFHAEDGRGYVLVADMVLAVDKLNPQVAARLAGAFSLWRKFENTRRNMMKAQLDRLMAVGDGLSRDTFEIVSQSLLSA